LPGVCWFARRTSISEFREKSRLEQRERLRVRMQALAGSEGGFILRTNAEDASDPSWLMTSLPAQGLGAYQGRQPAPARGQPLAPGLEPDAAGFARSGGEGAQVNPRGLG
jgi:hypothetical protein